MVYMKAFLLLMVYMNKVYLMRRLFNLQMSEGGSIANHINEFNMTVSQLSSVEINFDNEIKALI